MNLILVATVLLSLIPMLLLSQIKNVEELKWVNYQKSVAYSKVTEPGTYNPYKHQNSDGSINWSMRSYFYDEHEFKYRPYKNKEEVFRYLKEWAEDSVVVFLEGVNDKQTSYRIKGRTLISR